MGIIHSPEYKRLQLFLRLGGRLEAYPRPSLLEDPCTGVLGLVSGKPGHKSQKDHFLAEWPQTSPLYTLQVLISSGKRGYLITPLSEGSREGWEHRKCSSEACHLHGT